MGVVKTLLGVVILFAILVFGYWLYATYMSASADDPIWAQINENMPQQLRTWSCEQMNARLAEDEAPASCADVWQTAVAPNIDAEPSLQSSSGGQDNVAGSTPAQSEPATSSGGNTSQPATEQPFNDY